MFRRLQNRFRNYVRTIAAEVQPDILEIASHVDLAPVVEQVLDRVKTGHTVDYGQLAEGIDIEELAGQFDTADLAGEMDYSSLASEVDVSELAREFDVWDIAAKVDVSEVASAFDEDSIADRMVESLDYKRLALALVNLAAQGVKTDVEDDA